MPTKVLLVWVMTIACLACSSAFSDAAPQSSAEEKAATFTLKDEKGTSFTLTFPRTKPLLLTFGDQVGGMAVNKWRMTIEKKYGDRMEYCRVAWLELIPSLMRGAVEKIIKETYPGTLLDWSGDTAKLYGCKSNKANVFVINREGAIVYQIHISMSDKELRKVYKIVDVLLEEDSKS